VKFGGGGWISGGVRWTTGFDEDEEGVVRSGAAGFTRRERRGRGGGGSTASLSKQRREKGEGLGALARSRLEKMGLAPDRRGFVGAGREVIDTSLGATKLGGGGTSTEIGEKGGPLWALAGRRL
jgi:hypothetical protein